MGERQRDLGKRGSRGRRSFAWRMYGHAVLFLFPLISITTNPTFHLSSDCYYLSIFGVKLFQCLKLKSEGNFCCLFSRVLAFDPNYRETEAEGVDC
jgi:hypothetical protein